MMVQSGRHEDGDDCHIMPPISICWRSRVGKIWLLSSHMPAGFRCPCHIPAVFLNLALRADGWPRLLLSGEALLAKFFDNRTLRVTHVFSMHCAESQKRCGFCLQSGSKAGITPLFLIMYRQLPC